LPWKKYRGNGEEEKDLTERAEQENGRGLWRLVGKAVVQVIALEATIGADADLGG